MSRKTILKSSGKKESGEDLEEKIDSLHVDIQIDTFKLERNRISKSLPQGLEEVDDRDGKKSHSVELLPEKEGNSDLRVLSPSRKPSSEILNVKTHSPEAGNPDSRVLSPSRKPSSEKLNVKTHSAEGGNSDLPQSRKPSSEKLNVKTHSPEAGNSDLRVLPASRNPSSEKSHSVDALSEKTGNHDSLVLSLSRNPSSHDKPKRTPSFKAAEKLKEVYSIAGEITTSMFQISNKNQSKMNLQISTNKAMYDQFGSNYYSDRKLGPKVSNWVYGILFSVAAVISGQYGSWNFGLQYGWGSMLVSYFIATFMFWNLALVISELSCLMPFTGGSSNFATAAFGPLAGCVEGYCFYTELITFSAATQLAIGQWFCDAFSLSSSFQPIFWIILQGFSIIVFSDVKLFLRVNTFYCVLALFLIILVAFLLIPFSSNFTQNITGSFHSLLPQGGLGVFYSLPYAIWFYVGGEVVPFLSEETANPTKDNPRGLLGGMGILTIISLVVLVVIPGSFPGIDAFQSSSLPLTTALKVNFPNAVNSSHFGYFIQFIFLAGFIASYLSCSFSAQRSMYSLSRAGFFPPQLSLTYKNAKEGSVGFAHGAPYASIIFSSCLVFGLSGISLAANDTNGNFLVLACIAYALISYTFTFLAFIAIRIRRPYVGRPFQNVLGIPGAALSCMVSIGGLASLSLYGDLKWVLVAIATHMVLTIAYFILVIRHRIGFIPEKAFIRAQLKSVISKEVRKMREKSMKKLVAV